MGQSEQMIRDLFAHAQKSEKSTLIFIDEIDSLCRVRCEKEDECNRRIKVNIHVH